MKKDRHTALDPEAGDKPQAALGPSPRPTEPWLRWAMEMQSIGQCGLTYAKDPYDLQRYQRLRDLAAEMLSWQTELPAEKIKSLFCSEEGYQTPKLDTRAAMFRDGKILLVRERSGRWALPGGWVDVLESVASNTVKEVKEEAGLDVEARRIIAVQDRNRHNTPPYAYGICKVFVLCGILGGGFVENLETTASDFFPLEHLPPLAQEKTTREQIALCFEAYEAEHWETRFD